MSHSQKSSPALFDEKYSFEDLGLIARGPIGASIYAKSVNAMLEKELPPLARHIYDLGTAHSSPERPPAQAMPSYEPLNSKNTNVTITPADWTQARSGAFPNDMRFIIYVNIPPKPVRKEVGLELPSATSLVYLAAKEGGLRFVHKHDRMEKLLRPQLPKADTPYYHDYLNHLSKLQAFDDEVVEAHKANRKAPDINQKYVESVLWMLHHSFIGSLDTPKFHIIMTHHIAKTSYITIIAVPNGQSFFS